MASSRHSAAESLVTDIARSHGYLGEAVYARMDPDTRRKVQEAMLTKDKMIGSSVMLLARELYSKDVRFIFELLQNADDNHYTKARANDLTPYVAFHLRKRRIIIDCNEDGFSETNLRAICSIGNSSKAGGHGYIGEKGIGFKSVFKVAWKVHIQSGDFSFAFIHHPGDSGMGMISPEWEDRSEELTNPLTRITLYLFDDDEAVARHQSIEQQLNDLESHMLLFLKNLRRIDIHLYNGEDEEVSSTTMTVTMDEIRNKAVLRKCRTHDGTSEEMQAHCHVTKYQATSLEKSSHRTYTAVEEANQSYRTAEVILAFPLSENCAPIIEAQQVFAFLPLRRLGFNFLIQTDFVTMANREDVVTSAPRNLALLDGIADAFIKAVRQMYEHDTLRYQWMRYLSNMKSYPWDHFWKKLVDKIDYKLRKTKILQPRRRGPPRSIESLGRLTTLKSDKDGNPLFEDLPGAREGYISTGYRSGDLDILQDYGLIYLHQGQLLERVKHDLCQPNSRMKDAATNDDWHTRAAVVVNQSFVNDWRLHIAETLALSILPLSDGSWVSATARQVFFPKIDDLITVPGDLGLSILSPSACENTARVKLFTSLGARVVNVNLARERIFEQYTGSQVPYSINLETSHSHIAFLYHTHQSRHDFSEYHHIRLYDTEQRFLLPTATDCYFISEEPYSLWQLCQQGQDQRFRAHASFIHPRYFHSPLQGSTELSWERWLSSLGVRSRPRIVGRNGSALSSLFLHIAEELPSKFLGFLRYAFLSYERLFRLNETIIEAIQNVKVLCQGEAELHVLSTTYLPLPSLQEECSAFMDEDFFPFLELDGPWSSDEEAVNWGFLKERLGVGAQNNLQFYIDMVYWMREASQGKQIGSPSRILGVYARIQSRCAEARNRSAARELVRSKFINLVYIPQHDDEEGLWADMSDCLCDAPRNLQYKYAVVARYEAAFPGEDLSFLVPFFRDTLGIPSCSWTDVVEDLEFLKHRNISDFDWIRSRYEHLNQLRSSWVVVDLNTAKIRESFESESLIFVQNEQGQYKWVKPSDCLWSSVTEIRHKTSLNEYYDDDLEEFFVEVLGVSRLTIDMVYDELYGVDSASTTVKQVKDWLLSMSAFLETEMPARSSEKLLERRILPVRYPNGDVRLVAANIEFAIVDRRPLELLFRDKVKLLDFSLGEVCGLEPLLDWMNLRDRFLSKLIRKTSVVNPELAYPLSDPMRHIRRKAHALTRVAVHVKSPRTKTSDLVENLYALLLNAETWETHGISSILTMNQDGTAVSMELEQSEVHITNSETPLKIYVPHNEVLQEVCYGSALPEQLVRWMVTDPTTQQIEGKFDESAIKVVTGILGTKSAAAMDRILDMQGIVGIDIPNTAPEETNQSSGAAAAAVEPGTLRDPQQRTSLSAGRRSSPSTPSSSTADSDAERYYGSADDDDAYFHPHARHHDHLPGVRHFPPASHNAEQYRALLEHVVACARATGGLPRRGAASVSMHTDQDALRLPFRHGDSEWLLRGCATSFERDCKIGAAGELFAFEMLSSLLEDFERACWQSTMRRLVAGTMGHPEYVDMEPWTGFGERETSDIVYDDTGGVLTRLLVDGLYLHGLDWTGRRGVRYYIEVKSTLGDCDGPFYMSDRQHRMMNQLMTDQSVYLIFRVFSMTSSSIGAKIYVDPARMEREGLLKFSADKWTVTPGEEGLFS